jgi:hypothetical protein
LGSPEAGAASPMLKHVMATRRKRFIGCSTLRRGRICLAGCLRRSTINITYGESLEVLRVPDDSTSGVMLISRERWGPRPASPSFVSPSNTHSDSWRARRDPLLRLRMSWRGFSCFGGNQTFGQRMRFTPTSTA